MGSDRPELPLVAGTARGAFQGLRSGLHSCATGLGVRKYLEECGQSALNGSGMRSCEAIWVEALQEPNLISAVRRG